MHDLEPNQVVPSAPLRRGQFSLRTLFVGVTAVALICGMFTVLPIAWSASVFFLLLLIGLHVAGNAVGTTLRDEASRNYPFPPPAAPNPVNGNAAVVALPPHRLSERTALGSAASVTAALGGIVAAVGVAAALANCGSSLSAAEIAVGGLAGGVVGGFVGFLGGCFVVMFCGCVQQAQGEPQRQSVPDGR